MLEQVRSLAKEKRWSEVLDIAPVALASTHGDDAARIHLYISAAYASTATCPTDWNNALAHAEEALASSVTGSLTHTWALQKLTSLCVDTNRLERVMGYAKAYLDAAPAHPALAPFTPYVIRDMSHVFYRQGKFSLSATWRLRALRLFAEQNNRDEVLRTNFNIVWAYARAGEPRLAHAYLLHEVPWYMDHLLNGAKAVIAATEKRWQDAREYGLRALRGARLAHDYVDAAETALIVSQAQSALGNYGDVIAFIRLAALLAARQDTSGYALIVLSLRAKGGDEPYAATCFCGAGGYHPDCVFTTGVA